MDELREELVQRITNVIAGHQISDVGFCKTCLKNLYGHGGGMSLSRHHAEMIVEKFGLVDLFASQTRGKTMQPSTLPLVMARIGVVSAVDELLARIEDGGDIEAGAEAVDKAIVSLQSVVGL